MSLFLIEFVSAIGYLLAARSCARYLKKEKNGSWPLALSSWPEKATPKAHRRGRRCHTSFAQPYAK
jgi:hypothetical protein